jgi:transcriptional regulator GlxA family with amidase domain
MPVMRTEILLYDGFDELDAFGPFEVLSNGGFEPRFVTLGGAESVTASHGARVLVDGALSDAAELVVVPGGGWGDRAPQGAWAEAQRGDLPRAIAERHRGGATIASVCTGAMLLASAGLLKGRPAVTHHVALDDLEEAGADVKRDARVVDDGDILTAGGVTSGIDLALWIVERERGAEAADATAREIEHTRRDVLRAATAR